MSDTRDGRILAYLEGRLDPVERSRFEAEMARSAQLGRDVELARAGLEGIRDLAAMPLPATAAAEPQRAVGAAATTQRGTRGTSPWHLALACAATLAVAVPATVWLTGGPEPMAVGRPAAAEPSYVLVLQGRWPDAATVDAVERRRRAAEYWQWTSELAERGILVAAGDLEWEPGRFLDGVASVPRPGPTAPDEPGFLVGMLVLRVDGYEQAVELARACPHLRYGGSVSVRQVASGFVTVPGMGDGAG